MRIRILERVAELSGLTQPETLQWRNLSRLLEEKEERKIIRFLVEKSILRWRSE